MSADEPVQCSYPAPDPPVAVGLTVIPAHPCSYLPGRETTLRAFHAGEMPGLVYHDFLNANFRRAGRVIYQPICRGCRECMSLRVPVQQFRRNKSQRRCWNANADLIVGIDSPAATDEKFDLYRRYQLDWHDKDKGESRQDFENFLYHSPVDTLEFTYRDAAGALLAVGICDVCLRSLSSVYFYFDPQYSSRGLGTFGALTEIDFAARHGISHYYLGYWVRDCHRMRYKADFKPCEILHPDGCWRADL